MTNREWFGLGLTGLVVMWHLTRLIQRESRDPIIGTAFSWPPTPPQILGGLAVTAAGTGYILIITSAATGPIGLASGIALIVVGIVVFAVWGRRGRSA